MEARVIVGGEALIDVVRGSDAASVRYPGGGPYNTARTVARLGRPTGFLGLLSRDEDGRTLRDGLAADGVETDDALLTDLPTTTATATLDPGGSATYAFASDDTSSGGLTAEAALAVVPDTVEMLHVGSLGLVLEPTATALHAVATHVASRALVMADLNCRPAAIEDRDAYHAGLEPLLAVTDVVKASVEDLAWLDPDRPPEEAARALGPDVALITDGPRGATVVTATDERAVEAPEVAHVADTIGAGDAFGGAFLAWWHTRRLGSGDLADLDRVEEATGFACLVAARTCERPGAFPPTLSELGDAGI